MSDLDGDGDLDAVVGNGPDNVDYPGEPNRVWLNDGAGRFRDSGQRLVSTGMSGWEVTHAVALGDIDGDGDIDAVFGDALFLNFRSSDTVWINDGAGQFTLYAEPRLKPEGDHFVGRSEAVRLGDLDGDGDLDLFVGNCCRNEWGSNTQHGYSDAHNLV